MKKYLILIIIGLILIITGFIISITNPSASKTGKEGKKEELKELRKILREEISHDTAKEIVQFYLDKDLNDDNIEIVNASVLAHNEKGEYLVRLELKNTKDTMDTEIRYLEDGKWEVELPLKYSGLIAEKFTEFWGIEE